MDIGERLRLERSRVGLTQPGLAESVSVSKNTVLAWEKGSTAPNGFQLAELARLGFDVNFVITGERSASLVEELPADEQQIMTIFQGLTAQQRQALLSLLEAFGASK